MIKFLLSAGVALTLVTVASSQQGCTRPTNWRPMTPDQRITQASFVVRATFSDIRIFEVFGCNVSYYMFDAQCVLKDEPNVYFAPRMTLWETQVGGCGEHRATLDPMYRGRTYLLLLRVDPSTGWVTFNKINGEQAAIQLPNPNVSVQSWCDPAK